VTVFLDDSIAIASRPKIVLIVNDAAVGCIRNDVPVAEAIHNIAVGIEFDVRWRLLCNFRLLACHVIPINDENVILCVHAYTAYLSGYPFFKQRLWPAGIDYEFRATALCLHAAHDSQGGHEAYAKPNLIEKHCSRFHFVSRDETEFAFKVVRVFQKADQLLARPVRCAAPSLTSRLPPLWAKFWILHRF
jgi:hypothetical protein